MIEAVILGRADDDHATHTPAARAPRFTVKQNRGMSISFVITEILYDSNNIIYSRLTMFLASLKLRK